MSAIEMTNDLISDALNPESPSFLVIESTTEFKYLIKLKQDFGPLNKTIFSDTKDYDIYFILKVTPWFEDQIEPWLHQANSGPIERITIGERHSFFHRKLSRELIQHTSEFAKYLDELNIEIES